MPPCLLCLNRDWLSGFGFELLLELIYFCNARSSQFLLLFHHELLPSLLSYVSWVKLLKLAFVVFKHALLLFIGHTLYDVRLLQLILSFLDPGKQTRLLVVHLPLIVTLAPNKVIIVRVLLVQLRINLVSQCFLLKFNVTHPSVLLCPLESLVFIKRLIVMIEVSVGIFTKQGNPQGYFTMLSLNSICSCICFLPDSRLKSASSSAWALLILNSVSLTRISSSSLSFLRVSWYLASPSLSLILSISWFSMIKLRFIASTLISRSYMYFCINNLSTLSLSVNCFIKRPAKRSRN